MDLYTERGRSMPQRWTIFAALTLILGVVGWLLFGGTRSINSWLGWNLARGDWARTLTLFGMYVIVYARMNFMVFYLLKRSIPWAEAFTVPFAFGLYYIGFSLFALRSPSPLTVLDLLFVLIFLVGSGTNTVSEWKRDQWKRDPSNRGRLYTEGLFRYSMHISYFGDVMWVTGLAFLTRNLWSFLLPVMLLCLFVFCNIPLLDQHLAGEVRRGVCQVPTVNEAADSLHLLRLPAPPARVLFMGS